MISALKRSAIVVGCVLVSAIGIPFAAALPHADEPEVAYSFSATISDAPTSDARVEDFVTGSGWPSATLTTGNKSQRARAFSLQPGTTWAMEHDLNPVPAGRSGLPTPALDKVLWLAQNYFNISGRLEKLDGSGERDVDAEVRAYQLAVWSFSAGLDLDNIPADRIVGRAKRLATDATQNAMSSNRRSPVSQANLELTRSESFVNGERFVAHLSEVEPSAVSIPDVLLTFSIDDKPVRIMQTDSNGDAVLDLPNDDTLFGKVRATWAAQLGAGTVLQGSTGSVVLFESLAAPLSSGAVTHVDAQTVKEFKDRFVARALRDTNGLPSWTVILIGILLVIGVPALVASRFENAHGRAFFATLGIVLTASLAFAFWLDSSENKNFHPAWFQQASGQGKTHPIAPVSVYETSELVARNPNFYAGTCAFDGSIKTSWQSARFRGTGQMLAVPLNAPSLITTIEIMPGYFESEELYNRTGKPQNLEIFSDLGMIANMKMPDTTFAGRSTGSIDIERYKITAKGVIFIRVSRIEGDTRGNAAIAEIKLQGKNITSPLTTDPVVNMASMAPNLARSQGCGAS